MSGNERSRQGGYTLLELLVVLVIAALIAGSVAVAIPERAVSVRQLAEQVHEHLRSARSRAMTEGKVLDVSFSVSERRYQVGARWYDLPDDVALRVRSARELSVSLVERVRFFPDGTTSGGNIELTRGTETATLALNWLTGSIILDRS